MHLPSVWKVSGFEPSFMNFIFFITKQALKGNKKPKSKQQKSFRKVDKQRHPSTETFYFLDLFADTETNPDPKNGFIQLLIS